MNEDVVIVIDDGLAYLVFAKNPETTVKVIYLETGDIGDQRDYQEVANDDDYSVVLGL